MGCWRSFLQPHLLVKRALAQCRGARCLRLCARRCLVLLAVLVCACGVSLKIQPCVQHSVQMKHEVCFVRPQR